MKATERLIPLLVFVFAAVIYFPAHFDVSWDLSNYLVYARNLVEGQGVSDPDGQPVSLRIIYVLMLAGLIKAFGQSLLAVALFEALWAAFFVTTIYLFARKYFGLVAALTASGLFLLSPDLIIALPRHVDPVWPPFLFLALTVLEKRPVLAGVLTALAFLIKEVALLLVFVPAVLAVFRQFSDPHRVLVRYYAAAFGACVLGWVALMPFYNSGATDGAGYGQALAAVSGGNGLEGLWNLIVYGFQGLWLYVAAPENPKSLWAALPLFPLMIIALLWAAYAVLRNRGYGLYICLFSFVAFAPFYALSGQMVLRLSQNLFSVALLYVFLSVALVHFVSRVVAQRERQMAVCATLVCVLLIFQSVNSRAGVSALRERSIFTVRGFSSAFEGQALSAWFLPRLKGGENVMVGLSHQYGTDWAFPEVYRAYKIPFRQVVRSFPLPYFKAADTTLAYQAAGIDKSAKQKKFPPVTVFSYEEFLDAVKQKNVRYVAVARDFADAMIIPVLSRSADFIRIAEFEDNGYRVVIFQRQHNPEFVVNENEAFVEPNLVAFLKRLRMQDSLTYDWYIQEVLFDCLRMKPEEVAAALR